MMKDYPLLRRSAKVTQADDRVAIQYLDEEISMDGAAARLFGKLYPLLDGQRSIGQIAEQLGERPESVAALTRELGKAGVLGVSELDPSGNGAVMSGEDFYHLHRRYSEHWLREVYEHPFWDRVVSGRATRAQVLGFAFEKYHYIEGAYEHMALAAANATPEMMPHLARHFIEEYSHGDIYRRGLRSLFPDEIVLSAPPLPSTRALINYLSECAAKNSFGYYAGNEVLQMTENTSDGGASGSVDSFYDAMRRQYPYTGQLIDSFIAHTRADQKLGHEDVFLQMCRSIPPMSKREVKDAMNIARSMVEHLMLFMDGIDVYYANFPQMPRLASTLLSE